MQNPQGQFTWSGPKGGRKKRVPMAPQHIRIRLAELRPRRKGTMQEVLQLQLINYGMKAEGKSQISVMYGNKLVGSKSIVGLRSAEVHNLKLVLDLPRVAYSQERVPLQFYLNDLLMGIEQIRPSPLPLTMVKPVEGLGRTSILRGQAGPDCFPRIDVWLEPDRDTFFTDETFTLNWHATCADAVGINWDSGSAAEALRIIADARQGIYHDHGSSGVYGLPLEGNEEVIIGGPGLSTMTVYAIGADGARAAQTIEVNLINRPQLRDCGEDRTDWILDMLKRIEPLVHQGITLNENLDDNVQAFADGALDRYEFGLHVEETFERLDQLTFVCQTCTDRQMRSHECPGGDYNEAQPDEVNLQFSNTYYPTDYALLHEICHIAGFNSSLQPEYSHDEIEHMTAEVSNAPFA